MGTGQEVGTCTGALPVSYRHSFLVYSLSVLTLYLGQISSTDLGLVKGLDFVLYS